MSKKLHYFFVPFFIFILAFFIPDIITVQGVELEAISRLSQADDSLEAAYFSILGAERVGGDVSELIVRLNVVLKYRSKAERALELGEYETAVLFAEEVVKASNILFSDGAHLMSSTELQNDIVFRNQVILSFVVVCFTLMFGFLGWRLFKDYYVRRLMALRPEVVIDES